MIESSMHRQTRGPVTLEKGPFPSTEWSVISAARGGDEELAAEGLRTLVGNYWRPLYVYLRKCGESHEDASDSVQGFFEFVLSSGFLTHIKREGGRFRSYLLKSVDRWRSRRRVYEGAQKRGGQVVHMSLEGVEELGEQLSRDDGLTAVEAYDRQWAINLLGVTVKTVRAEYVKRGREEWYDVLQGALPGGGQLLPYVDLAVRLDSTEGAIKKAVHDLRNAFASRLREEIRKTVRTAEDAEDELRYLMSVMST